MRRKSTDMLTSAKTLLLACAFSVMFAGASYADTSTPSNLPKEETAQKETTSGATTKQETSKAGTETGTSAAKPAAAQTQPAATQPVTAQKNGWVQDSAGWMYYEAGDAVTDEWRTKDGSDRYLGPDGYMVKKEKIYDGDDVYYVDEEGKKAVLIWYWFDNDGWRFFGEDGAAYKSAKWLIDGKYSIFNSDGVAMTGYVGFDGNEYYDCNNAQDPVIEADYWCGEEGWDPPHAFVGWHQYKGKLRDSRYDGVDEIWVCYNSKGKKLTGTQTINGRTYELDNNGILILGDVHINYYPSETNKSHHISEYYNSGAADAVFISQGDTFEKEYPSSRYTFLYWIDDEGYTFRPNQKIPYDPGTYSLYAVWDDKEASKYSGGSGGGDRGGSSKAEYSKDYNKSRTQSVDTASQAEMNVGSGKSGPYVSGKWKQDANGFWSFTDNTGKSYKNQWAYVHNPYTTGQEKAGWFMFDGNGNIMTGWYTDPTDGHTYYLNENAGSGDLGQMVTGWVQIGGMWYLFNDVPDGTRGCLLRGPLAAPN